MTKILSLFTLCLMASAVGCTKPKDPIVGIWTCLHYPDERSQFYMNSEKLSLRIDPDGTYTHLQEGYRISVTHGHNSDHTLRPALLGASGTWKRDGQILRLTWQDGGSECSISPTNDTISIRSAHHVIIFQSQATLMKKGDEVARLLVGEWDAEHQGLRVSNIFSEEGTMKTITSKHVLEQKYKIDASVHPMTVVLTSETAIHTSDAKGNHISKPTTHEARFLIELVTPDIVRFAKPVSNKPVSWKYSEGENVWRRVSKK
ncbi:MAG: hypothetical protein Q8M07_06395 [Prosthecobacter sp.]|nr:hypothetical protein [Prosthecobacter sp.]